MKWKRWKIFQVAGSILLAFIIVGIGFNVNIGQNNSYQNNNYLNIPTITVGIEGASASTTVDFTAGALNADIALQQALNALPTTGGVISVVSAATFTLTAGTTVTRDIPNVTIVGTGQGTYFVGDGATPIFSAGTQTGWQFKDFRTDAGWITVSTAGDTSLERLWNGTSLVDSVVPSGTMLPSNPVIGQQFYQNTTGRDVLFQYDGTQWQPIQMYGTATLYVDPSGTDDVNHGTGTGANAFQSIAYMWTQIPSSCNNINIYLGTGTYTENLMLSRKGGDDGGVITIYGTLSSSANLTATGGTIGGAGGAFASITGTFSANAHNYKLVKFTSGTNNGLYRPIALTSTTDLWLAGAPLNGAPQNGDTYTVYDFGSVISGNTNVFQGQRIDFYYTKFTSASGNSALAYWSHNYAQMHECYVATTGATSALLVADGQLETYNMIIQTTGANTGLVAEDGGIAKLEGGIIYGDGTASSKGIISDRMSFVYLRQGVDIHDTPIGIYCINHSAVQIWGQTYIFIHGCSTQGINVSNGTSSVNTMSTVTYALKADNSTANANGADAWADGATGCYVF